MDQLRADAGRIDGAQAQGLIELLATWVVNAANDSLDVESVAGNLCRHDVLVLVLRDGGEGVGLFDAGPAQHVFIDAIANHHNAAEVRRQQAEGVRVHIEHRDLMTLARQKPGQDGAGPAAPHDDGVHDRSPGGGSL